MGLFGNFLIFYHLRLFRISSFGFAILFILGTLCLFGGVGFRLLGNAPHIYYSQPSDFGIQNLKKRNEE